jgi:methylated-DNA-protein-cysteine methyltransferase-like protein
MDDPVAARAAAVLAAIRAVPRGQVAGYGEIARRAGLPGRARLVARLLRTTKTSRCRGTGCCVRTGASRFPRSAGHREQCRRLRAEGVDVREERVRRMPRPDERDLDAALWGPGG